MKRLYVPFVLGAVALALLLAGSMASAMPMQGQGGITPQGSQPQASSLAIAASSPISTAFTYQGQLGKNGQPVSASCQMTFRLYDSASGGAQVGSPITRTVIVANGLFTERLDFGGAAFNGQARWLGIGVNCGDASYTDLGRQALTAAPYAHFSISTGALQGRPITLTAPASGQVLKWNGSAWTPALDDVGTGGTSGWTLTGNAGTNPSIHFLGTTDNVTLTLAVSGTPALRLIPNATSPNIIGGHISNTVSAGAVGATIGGGGSSVYGANVISGTNVTFATISGGANNLINGTAYHSFIGGGYSNIISGSQAYDSFIGGGLNNVISGTYSAYRSTIGGGRNNTISGPWDTVGGGGYNTVSGDASTIGGGGHNTARGFECTIGGGGHNTASSSNDTVGGGELNTASGGISTVGGGRENTASNTFATVGGGHENTASGVGSFVGGGGENGTTTAGNTASGNASTIGGGLGNSASATYATVAGGESNTAGGNDAAIGGGYSNTANGWYTMVPGGHSNAATGTYSFAAGRRAKANNAGAFVWADSTDADFASTAVNQFLVRANGGVGINTSSPAPNTLTVGGNGLRVATDGATFKKIQADTATLGAGVAGVNTFTINFPTAFSSAPRVLVTVRGQDYNDTFVVTTRNISTSQFTVNIYRVDNGGQGWLQNLQLDWIAWE